MVPHHDALVEEDRDAVADGVQAVQVVGHHQNRETEAVAKPLHEFVVMRGANRIETGRRLVQEQKLRIEGQGAGEARPLPHAAG